MTIDFTGAMNALRDKVAVQKGSGRPRIHLCLGAANHIRPFSGPRNNTTSIATRATRWGSALDRTGAWAWMSLARR